MLTSPDQPIAGPLFPTLEILILLLVPAMVLLMAAVHAWAPPEKKLWSLVALVFMSLAAGVTGSVHFIILTLGSRPEFASLPLLLSFRWPSLVYALDILAWDLFFALSMLCAAPAFRGSRLARTVQLALIASGVLALAGLAGLVHGDMRLRNIGIVGYDGVFLVVAVLLARLFYRTEPSQ